MLRPLLVTNDFLPDVGGIQQYVAQIAARMDHVGVFAPAHHDAADSTLRYPVWRGPRPYLWPTASTLRALRRTIAEHRATVVVFMAPAPLTPLGPATGLPWAACSHGAELVLPARLPGVRRILATLLGRADRLYAVSAYTAAVLRDLVGAAGPPVDLLRNGVDLERFHPGVDATSVRERHRLGPAPVVVTVGRLVPRKGQDRLIAAMPKVRETLPGARLLIVGDGRDRRRLERLAARHAPEAVVFTGGVEWSQLPAYYRAGDVFAHPNRSRWRGLEQEGFGVVFLEAQASGLPVIAGRSGGSPEALDHPTTGLLVDGRDSGQIADAIATILTDRDRAARMGREARRWVDAQWSWDTIVQRFVDDLARLTG
ncbi:MAG: glycosyltransferase family 4 protein [Actinobacteria bacterium]|nr:glycosyltransferase family 4 protein [Actinomycetota bacterium]